MTQIFWFSSNNTYMSSTSLESSLFQNIVVILSCAILLQGSWEICGAYFCLLVFFYPSYYYYNNYKLFYVNLLSFSLYIIVRVFNLGFLEGICTVRSHYLYISFLNKKRGYYKIFIMTRHCVWWSKEILGYRQKKVTRTSDS